MAKGQSRRNREIRKPKADKPKVLAGAPVSSTMAMMAVINEPKKKK